MTSARAGRLPVVVLAGFLGAGKTTVLNHLLANSIGVRIGAIVNDFGAVGIDALLVAGQAGGTVDMGNGCVCCTADAGELDAALAGLADPAQGLDAIVIEASGLAEPRSLIRMVAASSVPAVRYGGLVEIVDAAGFPRTRELHPELASHVALADLIVVNRTDLAAPAELAAVRQAIGSAVGPVPIIETSFGRLDPSLLFDPRPRSRDDLPRQMSLDELVRDGFHDTAGAEDTAGDHLHHGYRTVTFSHDGPMHPRRLSDLLQNCPAGIYRTKGIVELGDPSPRGRFEIQTVGRHITARAADDAPATSQSDAPEASTLVVIGTDFDEATVRRQLDACRADPAEDYDERAMLQIMRYCV